MNNFLMKFMSLWMFGFFLWQLKVGESGWMLLNLGLASLFFAAIRTPQADKEEKNAE